MLKQTFVLLMALVFVFSCGDNGQEKAQTQEIAELTVSELLAQPADYVDKPIRIEGMVVHVCRHGGKKMFITSGKSGERIKITTGPDISAFELALEGKDVIVEGVFKEQRIDGAYLDQKEADLSASTKIEAGHEGHDHEADTTDTSEKELAKKQIDDLRKQLEQCEFDHLSFYSVECTKFTEKEANL
ncbi:hypothetical protein JXJ21_03785 [candidate division KSB1 bacterium]|nr:hypothetical protein [candidate division KSB1 bacterium]